MNRHLQVREAFSRPVQMLTIKSYFSDVGRSPVVRSLQIEFVMATYKGHRSEFLLRRMCENVHTS